MKVVDRKRGILNRQIGIALSAAATLTSLGAALPAQAPNPTSTANPFFGSVLARPATSDTLKLSLDDAIRMGLDNNLGLKLAENDEKSLHGEKNKALQNFLPTITLNGDIGVHQQNLQTMGFSPKLVSQFSSLLGNSSLSNISYITRYDLTEGRIQFSQMLFSGPVIAAWKAAEAAENSARNATASAREEVVQQVASAYLRALAASSQIDDARALEAADQMAFEHAQAAHQAGTVANLDELRARVQLQAQQQVVIAAQNALDKNLILLKREIGISPGQAIALTDAVPYSELALQSSDEICASAYRRRNDYRKMQNQVIQLKAERMAYRSQRLPSISFGGNYGVSTVNGAGTHGNFAAQGNLSFPLFREASLRGNVEAAQARLSAAESQLADLRGKIEEEVRSALLDVNANSQLVEVARSNVALATQALADETDRVNAGIDDNLPLVTAQANLSKAQNNLVESLYQLNLSKLALARASGVIEEQYRVYLGTGRP
jgi:outer membrane protein TolC